MTYPCVDPDHFEVDDGGALSPQHYMQWRHVATNSMQSFSTTLSVSGGSQPTNLGTFVVSWTNSDPIDMQVYGLLTRGGSVVTTTARTRMYLDTYYGLVVGTAPADPTASTQIGRMGNGVDFGLVNSNNNSNYGVCQTRQAERSVLVGATQTVTPGQTMKISVNLQIAAGFWETLPIENGSSESELSVLSGESRLDLFAIPVI
jgi:hypothetical protein